MALPVVPLFPGVGRGTVRKPDASGRWSEAPDVVLVASAARWPSLDPSERSVRAVVTDGLAVPTGARATRPTVGGVDDDILVDGELAEVDGDAGTLSLPGAAEVRVVTAFLERADGRVLLLRRSSRVGSFRGRWAGISGYLETPAPIDQARREIAEETGIAAEAPTLRSAGPPVLARDGTRVYVVYPFRFRVADTEVRLDWEHTEAEWVTPDEIDRRDTVPKLGRAWRSVAAEATTDKAYSASSR